MGHAVKKKTDGKYTDKDYLTWPKGERWELINGETYDMTPAPTPRHQTIAGNLYSALKVALKGGPCRSFIAPTDVVLSERDVVQSDVFVVCDAKKITGTNIQGAPDLVVEVISPATSLKDKRDKKSLYERSGVKEYVIAYPEDLFLERYRLIEGKYTEPDIVGHQETLTLAFTKGIDMPLWEVFETEPPKDSLDSVAGNIV